MASWSRLCDGRRIRREGKGVSEGGEEEKQKGLTSAGKKISLNPFFSLSNHFLCGFHVNLPRSLFKQLVQPLPRRVAVQRRLARAKLPLELGDARRRRGECQLELPRR